jgi:hypothetical protein
VKKQKHQHSHEAPSSAKQFKDLKCLEQCKKRNTNPAQVSQVCKTLSTILKHRSKSLTGGMLKNTSPESQLKACRFCTWFHEETKASKQGRDAPLSGTGLRKPKARPRIHS